LDGTNTDKDPYTCQSGTSEHLGIYIDKSLSLIGSASPMPQIRCSEGTGLVFVGSENANEMTVTLSGLFFNESFVRVQDFSVEIDSCKFGGSKQGFQFVIRTKMVSSTEITNSTFSKNSKCISVVVNNTESPPQNIQVAFKLINSSFLGNILSDKEGCISFTELAYTDQSAVSCNITLENVMFSRNKFSSKGLVFLKMDNGNQSIYFQNVTFADNSLSSDRDILTGAGYSECIACSSDVNILINSSNFTSEAARSVNISASNITSQIYNSLFCGHRVEGNGGAIFLRGLDFCKLKLSNSSFVNTSAAQGGAINIKCTNLHSVSFEANNFTGNTARNGGGGAVYIDSYGSVSNTYESSVNHDAESNIGSAEHRLQMDIFKCNFSNNNSSFRGGAMYVKALAATVRLRHSKFTNCTTQTGKREEVGGGGGVFIHSGLTSLKQNSGNDILLFVERSHFQECRSVGLYVFGGSLSVLYENQIEVRIKNSTFSSNYAGDFLATFSFGGAVSIFPLNIDKLRKNASHITIEHTSFSNNSVKENGGAIFIDVNNQSILVLENVIMESNSAGEGGGAAAISPVFKLKIRHSRFLKNKAPFGGAFIVNDVNVMEVQDSLFDGGYTFGDVLGPEEVGGALYIKCSLISTSILIFNTKFNNCSASQEGGAIYLFHKGNVSIEVNRSQFVQNVLFSGTHGHGGVIALSLAPDPEKRPGCMHEGSVRQTEFPSWLYKSHLIFEGTTFERNAGGYAGGAVYLSNGKTTFRNCHFLDNFAATLGGHIYTAPGSASLIIQDSIFRQTMNELQIPNTFYSGTSLIHVESSGALEVFNSTVNVSRYGSTNLIMQVRNGRKIDVGNKNLTTFYCPVGSQMEILNFTDQVATQVNNTPCKIEVTTLEFRCSACTGNSYSVERGRAFGLQLAPGFQCLPCPFGANCSQNIIAEQNFWGYKEHDSPPTLKFTRCPLGYCRPPQVKDVTEYNGCQGNRFGDLCGQCNKGYTETLYSTNCRPFQDCMDYWFWPVALVYVSLMALYFTCKPPIVPWIKRQILWFKKREPADEENIFDNGYLKIVFYFYQAANLVLVSNSAQHIFETKFIGPFVGLFNFQQRFSPSGLICPFPGLTVVTKQLFSASHVLGIFLMIGVFFILHVGVNKFRGQEVPSAAPYMGGILQTMLLGYTALASVSFNLLRCVPIGSEKRLFYGGNVVCFQWWQYILIAFNCTFTVPFVFVLLWGSFKLYGRTISVGKFLLACCLPLPSLLCWAYVSLLCEARIAANQESPSSPLSRNSVERVLYDCFKRPEDGSKLSLSWEGVMIGRRLILIVLKAFVSDPMPRLLVMSFFCVLFLQHHSMTQPFRESIANMVETISLLVIVLLGMINMFFASFLSLAVKLNDHFSSWWKACQVVEIVILCSVPFVFGLLVVIFILSQVCRLLYHMWVCFSLCRRKQDVGITTLLSASAS